MPAMPKVLHLFDASIPPPAPRQLALVAARRPGDVLVRLGGSDGRRNLPAPTPPSAGHSGGPWRPPRPCAGWPGSAAQEAIHCWNPQVAGPGCALGSPAVLSLFAPPPAGLVRWLNLPDAAGLRLLVNSPLLAEAMTARGVSAAWVAIIPPMTVAIDRSDGARRRARAALGLSDDQLVLLARPPEAAGDGLVHAVWAMAIVRQILREIRLVIPGVGRAVERAESFARQTGFRAETVFPGCVGLAAGADEAAPTVQALWSAADAALLCGAGGFALAELAQAVRAGVPVVAEAAGELGAVLEDGQSGILCRPSDPRSIASGIWRLHSQPDLAPRLAANAAGRLADALDDRQASERLDQAYRF